MSVIQREETSGEEPKPAVPAGKPEINLQDLADRILSLMKKDARIEQERLGKKPQRPIRR